MINRQFHVFMLFVLLILQGCSAPIELPAPGEFSVKLVGAGAPGVVEVSWKLVLRVDTYILYYGEAAGGPYDGKGLNYLEWTGGCVIPSDGTLTTYANGDGGADALTDGATTQDGKVGDQGTVEDGAVAEPEAGPQDSGTPDLPPAKPGLDSDSPIKIPASWCLSLEETYTDAGPQPSEIPGRRPKLRLQHLQAGKTYFFKVQAERNGVEGVHSPEVSILIPELGK